MNESELVVGHEPLNNRLNVRKSLRRWKINPLQPLLSVIGNNDGVKLFEDDLSMYSEMYWYYYLSLERFLPKMSLAVRWSKGPYWAKRKRRSMTDFERQVHREYSKVVRYVRYDFFNCLLYARMLLDRTIALSRTFISDNNKPSFTSFSDHKKFFKRLMLPYGENEGYADYIRNSTSWFDMPLKYVRDNFIVHAASRHLRIFGFPSRGHELGLSIILPGPDKEKQLAQVRWVSVSVPRLANDIETFLNWYCAYALQRVNNVKNLAFCGLPNYRLHRSRRSEGLIVHQMRSCREKRKGTKNEAVPKIIKFLNNGALCQFSIFQFRWKNLFSKYRRYNYY